MPEGSGESPAITAAGVYPTPGLTELSHLASGMIDGGPASPEVPVVWPLQAGRDLIKGLLGSNFAQAPSKILVHESLSITCPSLPEAGESFLIEATWSGSDSVSINARFATSAGKDKASLSANLRWIDPEMLARLKPIDLSRAARGAELVGVSTGLFDQSKIDRFIELSGDPNPLHVDTGYARQFGLEDTVIPGALLASLVEPALGILRPRFVPDTLSVRFLAPMISGQALRITACDIGGPASGRMRVFLSSMRDRVAAIADVGGVH